MEGRRSMTKKKQSSDEEIWSKRFDEDYGDLEYVSRSERTRGEKQRNDDGMSPMLTGTVIFLAVLILATIFYYVWYSNRSDNERITNDPEMSETAEAPEDNSDTEPETDSNQEDEEVATENEAAEEQPESTPEPEPDSETEPEPDSDSESTPDPETEIETEQPVEETPSTPETSSGDTYIVQAGDNMYRIALNHGMTTQELMDLNGLTEETVYVGQELKVE